jgi:hypothetical protein
MNRRNFLTLSASAVILAPIYPLAAFGAAAAFTVIGGGESMITGGNGTALLGELMPVKTLFSFHATKARGGAVEGKFECLALAPSGPSGAGSGQFTQNVMYVTGGVTALEQLSKDTALIKGEGRCSGLGAGEIVIFEATVTRGGPGATIRLKVNTLPGIEFFEIVTSGSITFSN